MVNSVRYDGQLLQIASFEGVAVEQSTKSKRSYPSTWPMSSRLVLAFATAGTPSASTGPRVVGTEIPTGGEACLGGEVGAGTGALVGLGVVFWLASFSVASSSPPRY